MRLVQFRETGNGSAVAVVDGNSLRKLKEVRSVHELALKALAEGGGLSAAAERRLSEQVLDYTNVAHGGRLLPPVTMPEPSRLRVTGTGLTHIGSAQARDNMHVENHAQETASKGPQSDSMKMFKLGLEGGKPAAGRIGAMPEWFYKGDGDCLVPSGASITMPSFALAAGEEPEIAGVYIIDAEGAPWRIGFTLANDFSDHLTEEKNYMYIAHSKLRECPLGPELLVGELPADVRGESRLLRAGKVIWRGPFASGESNMSYSIGNLEHHHFKYPAFRRPGDIHVHLFGCPVLSFAEGVRTQAGDVFEIEVAAFGRPLRSTLVVDASPDQVVNIGVL
ncbi:MAG: AraD1 family protein [Betaproteobacteria bacterium]